MSTTVSMPQLGETVTEGTILSWAKNPGDTIAEDETLLEISTDKVDTEVPSPVAGVILEILVPEGETVQVGTPLVVIGDADEQVGEASTAPALEPAVEEAHEIPAAPVVEAVGAAAATAAAAVASGIVPANLSPVVRKLAAEHDVDLTKVQGTGRDGRITRKDVMGFVESGGAGAGPIPSESPAEPPAEPAIAEVPPSTPSESVLEPMGHPAPAIVAPAFKEPVVATEAAPEPTPAPGPASAPAPAPVPAPASAPAPTPPPAPVPAAAPTATPTLTGGGEVVELSRLRTRIAENMSKAKQTAAHVWTSIEVDFEVVERVRQAHKEAWKAQEGFSLTYLPFIARATIDALAAYPKVNSYFFLEEGHQVMHRQVHLGIAIDLNQEGLVVTPVKGADGLRLRGIAREVNRLAGKARGGDLEPDDLTGGTFTITNPGPFGSFMSAPIINVPQVAILSTDTVTKRPTVVTNSDGSDAIAIHHIGYLGLTWDHRAFDGSTAVLFLARIKENLQNWDWEQELQ